MEEKRNNSIDDVGLSESTSLTHLLDGDDETENTGLDFIKHSPYYSEHDYLNIRFGKGKLGIMSLNCQSINSKFEEFRLFIDRINKVEDIGVVCLQETWTSEKDDVSLFHLPNYKLFHKGKTRSSHGGLFMYVHGRFKATQLNMTFTSTMWESQCVKITQSQPYTKQHIIGNIYRPPFEGSDDFDLFLQEFNDFVNIMSSYGHSSYICGDFNINLLKINTKPHYNNFFKNMLSAGFFPKITLPTRICDTSSTLIDNIYSNDLKSNDISGIFVSHISDHQAIFTTTNTLLNKGMDNQYIILETKK